MVVWADSECAAIKDIFGRPDIEAVGSAALSRCLVVYPWTQRYFGKFGNLYNAAAIITNPKVADHGKTVIRGLIKGVQDLDKIKETYKELSILHSEKLNVEPVNFWLLSDCVTIVLAGQMGSAFTPEVHAALQKFLAVAVSALMKQYQ
ncbi:hemoglobin subunit beta-2-like [Thalassophryne amazonica]|uniref:hemoglobin subunit beta-2-like n=1 Tax=Thalassophryne amazonica TaxID=390379 RepID=UPI0014709E53|nr:hemoglobin subunit beta-2-like [Thalassophryne amazonica]